MAIFEITEGAPGQGKSLYTARLAQRLLRRNEKWFKKTGIQRKIVSNIKFSPEFEEKWCGWIEYWTDTAEICKMSHVDLIWDEIATELDARNYANLSIELKRFLSQYRKRGVDVYANTQDYSMIDARCRLMVTNVRTLQKIIGSSDISTTKPKPKFIWGLIFIRNVINFKEVAPEKKKYELIPSFMLIEKEYVQMYDTTQDIPMGKLAPLKHLEYECELGEKCTFRDHGRKIVHQ